MVKGRSKGLSAERRIAYRFSEWLGAAKGEPWLWRSIASGALATTSSKSGDYTKKGAAGDLMAVNEKASLFIETFYVEIKSVKDLQLESLLLARKGFLYKVWKDTQEKSLQYSRVPVVVAKQNRYPEVLVTDASGVKKFGVHRMSKREAVIVPDLNFFLFQFEAVLRESHSYWAGKCGDEKSNSDV
jgi:hypothetical protein